MQTAKEEILKIKCQYSRTSKQMQTQIALIYKLKGYFVVYSNPLRYIALSLWPAWKISRSLTRLWACGSHSAALPVCLISYIEEDGNISVSSCFSNSYQGHVRVIVERPTNIYQKLFSNPLRVGGGNTAHKIVFSEWPLMQAEPDRPL